MKTYSRLLVVRPTGGAALSLTPDKAEALIRHALTVKKPAKAGAGTVALEVAKVAVGIAWGQFGISVPSERDKIEEAMPLMVKLLTALVARNPGFVDPELRLVQEGDDELESLRVLGSGYFATNVVYAMHPHERGSYISVAQFHSYLLDEKRAEFERLACALGARRVFVVEADETTRQAQASAGVSAPVAGLPVGISASGGKHSGNSTRFTLDATFDVPRGEPRLPDGLRWFNSEPQWQAMAEARLGKTSVLSRRVTFQYSSDYSIDANLELRVKGLGLSCGGSFQAMRDICVDCLVEFHPRAAAA